MTGAASDRVRFPCEPSMAQQFPNAVSLRMAVSGWTCGGGAKNTSQLHFAFAAMESRAAQTS
eukprot:CAMPEP_0175832304 /NCGR_PEP_ID=MMETSP0107_2-20121207/14915_1 /TAXON_ID=195067 ORGANISM="Goniomonas pacifica, Strain CCMP1869" /NCGR_SAMPLE_ID=MMETSP0107_2 /ASSEMBLY_ACC=CAM_ASM_000203 /LENGTH=61 /DNA_ID=CAMNT_0017145377 /DNA_START=320 /DNA_END=501 /DNA_ORIENTATION=-